MVDSMASVGHSTKERVCNHAFPALSLHPSPQVFSAGGDGTTSHRQCTLLYKGVLDYYPPLPALSGSKRVRSSRTFALPANPPPAASSPRAARPSNWSPKPPALSNQRISGHAQCTGLGTGAGDGSFRFFGGILLIPPPAPIPFAFGVQFMLHSFVLHGSCCMYISRLLGNKIILTPTRLYLSK